jgi:hypothetical protein
MDRLTSAILRRLKDAKASCPVTVYVKLDDAAKLIEAQAKEIERLRNGTNDNHTTG